MAFCSKCGSRIDDHAAYCPVCGNAVAQNTEDEGGFAWNLFGFCCPVLITFIMYLVWQNTKPNRAEAICHGALFAWAISFILGVLSSLLGAIG